MLDVQQHWEQVWTSKVHSETSWYQADPVPSLELMDVLGITPDVPVIDVGCGESFVVDRLIDRGYLDLHLLDVSESALSTVMERLAPLPDDVTVTTHAVNVLDLDPVPSVGVWHDRAMLHFIRDQVDREWYAELAFQSIRPGGFLVIGGFAPDGPEQCSNLEVQRAGADEIETLFGDRFERVDAREQEHRTPWESNQRFQWTVLRRRSSADSVGA